jgi:hypothetical protein
MIRRKLLIGFIICALVTAAAITYVVNSPVLLYKLTGSVRAFNTIVSRDVPKGSDISRLETVAGTGKRVPAPDWLLRDIQNRPERYPDGWKDGDTLVSYEFPGKGMSMIWYIQVREGRLVNYDPAELASQPQDRPIYTLAAPPAPK